MSAAHAVDATVRLYDRLFNVENPAAESDRDFREMLNPDSLRVIEGVKVEPFIAENSSKGKNSSSSVSAISRRTMTQPQVS